MDTANDGAYRTVRPKDSLPRVIEEFMIYLLTFSNGLLKDFLTAVFVFLNPTQRRMTLANCLSTAFSSSTTFLKEIFIFLHGQCYIRLKKHNDDTGHTGKYVYRCEGCTTVAQVSGFYFLCFLSNPLFCSVKTSPK